MKNLKLLRATLDSTVIGENFCVDGDDNVYFAGFKKIFSWEKSSKKILHAADIPSDDEAAKIQISGMEYLFENNAVFFTTTSGDLYLYSIDDQNVECVGMVESGIETFSWSSDQEYVVLITGNHTLILMTREFDAVTEKDLCNDDFGAGKPINVGWGSKTTQFHGSEGKGAALVKQKELTQAIPYDDRKTRISWRADGEYFVTSSIDANKGYRLLRIWSQEAVLQFTSELVEGLEEPISWRPMGNVIACSQQCPNKHKIIFFEKNGLRHGEFALPFQPNTYKVSELSWNSVSSILLVVAEKISNASDFEVMLWTSSNYHWYLKQQFHLLMSSPHSTLITKWSADHPYQLQCYNQLSGAFYGFKWTWTTFHAPVTNKCEDSIVASIDNDALLISPFGKLVVPPPMCAYMLTLSSSVQSVFFAPDDAAFGAYLSNSTLVFFQKVNSTELKYPEDCKLKLVAAGGNGFKSQVQPYFCTGSYRISFGSISNTPFELSHWTWIQDNRLLCVGYYKTDEQTSKYGLFSFEIPSASEIKEICGSCVTNLETSVAGMCSSSNGSVVAILLENGKVLKLELGQSPEMVTAWCSNNKNLVLQQPCHNISIISIQGKDHLLGLSEKYNLFCDDLVILSQCTSFYIHEEYLLATTMDHVLKCFSIKYDLPAVLKNRCPLPSQVQTQKIEKGAEIVIVPSKSTKVILQMPRGNLETIHPRALVLSAICKHLNNLEFGKAFEISKVHRIDLNVLFDQNPERFLKSIDQVVEQINSPSDLNLFLASLKNEDVCLTMYPLYFEHHHVTKASSNKINEICDAFREALLRKNKLKYYQTVLATYAKKDPPELDQALIQLKLMKDSKDSQFTAEFIDSCLNFLLYLVDVETLKNTALTTYDLEITIMVEQKSQQDPKEFLPFYNSLQKLEENYRKYTIDMHLQRYKQALVHISKCDDHFEECLSLIKEQRLYTDALSLFPPSSDQLKSVWKEYGNYLMDKRYFDEAGLAYTRCDEFEKSLVAYKESLSWERALCVASDLNYTEVKMIALAEDLSAKLKSNQKYVEASYILEHYVKDIEESIVALIEGSEWNLALLKISKYKRQDITETHLVPALTDSYASTKSHLEELHELFNKHLDRLNYLRTQKKTEAEQSSAVNPDEDMFSDTNSMTDASSCVESSKVSGSIMTRKSSKSRRKQKLKKYRLKEGSADEDLALIVALSEIVIQVDEMKDNFQSFLKALFQFGHDKLAKELQQLISSVVKLIGSEIPNIWNSTENKQTIDVKFGPDSTANSIAASLQETNTHTIPSPSDPELAQPRWRNIEFMLQILN